MRVIIYGAGAIGGVVGGHLARTGQDVVLIGRSHHVEAINKNGFRLVTPTGIYVLKLPAVFNPDQIDFRPDDVVFLTMKGQDAEEALVTLKKIVSDMPIFCLQNGVRNEEIAARYFPMVYGAMVRCGAFYVKDGEVTAQRDPPGSLIIGCYPRGMDELAEAVGAKLRAAGFIVLVTRDVMPYKWGKLMDNLANAVGAITNARFGDTAAISGAARQELQDLLTQAGIRWVTSEELARDLPEAVAPPRGKLDYAAQSSTWQSLTRKTGTIEAEFLNGEVVRLAVKMGRKAPVNEKLVNICLEMAANRDLPGKYTPSQLAQLLGIM